MVAKERMCVQLRLRHRVAAQAVARSRTMRVAVPLLMRPPMAAGMSEKA